MSDTHESHAAVDQPGSPHPHHNTSSKFDKSKTRKNSETRAEPAARSERRLLAITVDADTARVVRIEGLDPGGTRHALTRSDRELLLNRGTDGRVEDIVERAFEAGIACVLDDETASASKSDSADDAELRHQLLAPLIERSAVRDLIQPGVLDRAILSTLIDHASRQA